MQKHPDSTDYQYGGGNIWASEGDPNNPNDGWNTDRASGNQIGDGGQSFSIGYNHNNGNPRYLSGCELAEIVFYNTALTENTIQDIYNAYTTKSELKLYGIQTGFNLTYESTDLVHAYSNDDYILVKLKDNLNISLDNLDSGNFNFPNFPVIFKNVTTDNTGEGVYWNSIEKNSLILDGTDIFEIQPDNVNFSISTLNFYKDTLIDFENENELIYKSQRVQYSIDTLNLPYDKTPGDYNSSTYFFYNSLDEHVRNSQLFAIFENNQEILSHMISYYLLTKIYTSESKTYSSYPWSNAFHLDNQYI